MGLDQPIWKQFFDYVWALLHGDFGTSIISKSPIADEFLTLFPATLELTFCAMLFAVAVGVPAGVIAAARRGGIYDQTLMGAGAHRLFHADLLVGPHPHSVHVEHAGPDAGFGPHRSHQISTSSRSPASC